MKSNLIVMKFGGTSVADRERLLSVSKIIKEKISSGSKVIAVVSAQGNTTDDLLSLSGKITDKPSLRELDVLLSTGEQVSIALLSMTLESVGVRAISLTGWQAGIKTCNCYSNAKILDIFTYRIEHELENYDAIIVAGFQGLNQDEDITTMGRGGSDTSAVAIAAAMKAKECLIYTDVDGVYTADPRVVKDARKISEISYDSMIKMADMGAKVLNKRSVRLAKKYGVEISVLNSMSKSRGTRVKEVDFDANPISSLAVEKDLTILKFKPENFDFIFEKITKSKIGHISDLFFERSFALLLLKCENLKALESTLSGFDSRFCQIDKNMSRISVICNNQDIIYESFFKIKKITENPKIRYVHIRDCISIVLETDFSDYFTDNIYKMLQS